MEGSFVEGLRQKFSNNFLVQLLNMLLAAVVDMGTGGHIAHVHKFVCKIPLFSLHSCPPFSRLPLVGVIPYKRGNEEFVGGRETYWEKATK